VPKAVRAPCAHTLMGMGAPSPEGFRQVVEFPPDARHGCNGQRSGHV